MPILYDDAACRSCGGTERIDVTFAFPEGGESTHTCCRPCHLVEMAQFEDRRRQFEFLLANGVSRKRANWIMIKRIDPTGRWA